MDIITYALCKKMVNDISSKISTVFTIKGKVSSVEELPQENNHSGDVYLVGPQADNSYSEYYWSDLNKWDLLGNTAADMSSYITDKTLYKGQDETGTIENPAEGTILAILKTETVSETKVGEMISDAMALEII